MPSVSLALGLAVAKSAVKLWFRDVALAQEVGLTLSELLARRIDGEFDQRRAQRSFDRMAEEVADRLQPYISVELPNLPEHEKAAACNAVVDALNGTPLGADTLFSTDLDPLALELVVRGHVGDMAKKNLLSESGTALFDRLLAQACAYVVQVAISLPAFDRHASVELLRRESTLLDLLQELLRRVPEQAPGIENEDLEFEWKYLLKLNLQLDRLELFGLSLSDVALKRYSLTVAYISLTATAVGERNVAKGEGAKGEPDPSIAYIKADEALRDANRVILRGEAGSGKTTLLQWLAVDAARQRDKTGTSSGSATVPFYIQLRRYVGRDLPRPEQFLEFVAPNLVGRMPQGWVHDVLEQGRGLVLVDGVDEFPHDKRADAKEWLLALTRDFPESRFIVSSRPPAVSEDWLGDSGFATSDLLPMGLEDITAFVQHWHSAIGRAADEDELQLLRKYESQLLVTLRDNQQLRSLATSPLLCAMLCALNKERRTQLPKDRLELYRISLETLLDRRDVERAVPSDIELSYPKRRCCFRALRVG